jgi:dTDP-4-dehydrorhamnose reductase
MKYLIAGRNGQLAREFIKTFEARSVDFSAPEESHLDITDMTRVSEVVDSYRPDIILNCAAYNLVDRAEQQKEAAFAVNAIGPRNLARVAAKQNILLVHFSSDYVFDGAKENGLYDENDAVNPVNVYGQSKLAGEKYAQEDLERLMILRLSWVFGEGAQNFIRKVREWSKKSDFLKITCDEFSVPTYTGTVVDVTMRAISQGVTGLYHLTNTGFCSRYEWAKLILGDLGITKFIRPVTLDEFRLPATRPKFSAMSNEKIAGLLKIEIPTWESEVISFLRKS